MASCLLHFFHRDLDHGVEYTMEPMGISIIRVTHNGAEQPFSPALWGAALGTIAKSLNPDSGLDSGWGPEDIDFGDDD
jgi:hypothetical protein